MTPDKLKSDTWMAVAIICVGFILETANLVRSRPNFGTTIVLSLLGVVAAVSIGYAVVYRRRDAAMRRHEAAIASRERTS